jgi:hypothetical protein
MSRFLVNLWFFFYFFFHYKRIISMSLSPAQLQTLQNDLDTLKAAVAADTTATDAVTADAAQLAVDQAAAAVTGPAVLAAEQQLLADAQADFNPAA